MSEYLVLLKLSPGKIIDAMDALRSLPDQPTSGVTVYYTMNIFGTWDVAMWIAAEKAVQVVDFVHKRIKEISGVANVYTVTAFPHGKTSKRRLQECEEPVT